MLQLSFGPHTVSRLSTEYVMAIQHTGLDESWNPLPAVPINGSVEFAFVPFGEEPIETDWVPGEGIAVFDGQYARTLIGPEGQVELQPGKYHVWVRIIDPPEKGVQKSGVLNVY